MADELATNLSEASFEGTRFPVESATTESGHDAAEHAAYRRRGVDIEPTGRQADRGTLIIPCVNAAALVARYGEMFPTLYATLRALFDETPIGQLVHPTRGSFRALIKSWHEELSPTDRSGTRLRVEWVEHNGEALVDVGADGAAPTDTTATAEALATEADGLGAGVEGWAPLAPVYEEQLAFLEGDARSWAEIGAAFRVLNAALEAALALPALAEAANYLLLASVESLRATTQQLEALFLPAPSSVRLFTVPQTMALWQVAQLVYGDASRDTLLAAANAIPDPLFVAAGTVLTVLPNAP